MIQAITFDRNGIQLAEIEFDISDVTWRLNNWGQAKASLNYSNDKCTRTNLLYGNRVLLRFDNGLPDFGGVIDPPMQQDFNGVTATIYSGERVLHWRRTPKGRYFDVAAPGYIYKTLIEEENTYQPMGVLTGDISYAGRPRTLQYHYHNLLQRVKDLSDLTGMDFYIEPEIVDGNLMFRAHWYDRRGIDRTSDVHLIEGLNCEVSLNEQGDIAGRVILAGAGQTWGADRYVAISEDDTSLETYGFREYAEVQSSVTVQATLDENAEALLAEKKQASKRFRVTAYDREPGLFADYDVGDIVRLDAFLKSTEWAFSGDVRVLARQYQPNSNQCRLEVEEWIS